jgi:hypothetical protein
MSDIAWEIEHSVETTASPAFAWEYMSNVENWDDPPAQFKLDGPFAAGSRGTTHMPGQEPLHWTLRAVSPPSSYTIEGQLDRASMLVKWQFNGLPDGRTRLTQHIVLKGENAAAYLPGVAEAFTANLAPGMNRIAAAIGQAELLSRT